jgi:REP element-mobilizing transposase RayT
MDTRNNWLTFQFEPKCRFRCFRRQSVIDSCTAGFKELEKFGFEFGEMGFPVDHVHLDVNVPKRYSVQVAEIMLKDHSAKRILAEHPGFKKRYPRGGFWAGWEHHESTGRKDREKAEAYIRDQLRHHNVTIIDDRQQKLTAFSAG